MPNILHEPVEKYIYALLPRRDAVLAEMERLAEKNDILGRARDGHYVGERHLSGFVDEIGRASCRERVLTGV